jgi:ABC-three component (ABC-3C) system Middle Component 2
VTALFNSPLEVGLRAVCVLVAAFPAAASLQRLVIFDYLIVHSDDAPDGPPGLHPRMPLRGGEILSRRQVVQQGLALYRSRGLVERRFTAEGVAHAATERSAGFLDGLGASYLAGLRERAIWLAERFDGVADAELEALVRRSIGRWGAEFTVA